MNPYTDTITMKLPLELASVAAAVGRALDPDVGGADSFHRIVGRYDGEIPIYGEILICSTLCTAEFKKQAEFMLTHPEVLFTACIEDYNRRWPEFTPPTLEECAAFCQAVTIE